MSSPQRTVPRDVLLDVARGLAMVAVVLGHVLGGLADAGIGGGYQPWTAWATRLLYLTHLPVFAFVTGLLAPRGVERLGRAAYLWNRLTLLAYVYVLWTLIEGSVEVLTSRWKNHPTTWANVFSLWVPIGHLWFIPTLMVATCAIAVVRPWRRSPLSWLGLLVSAVAGLAAWGWGYPLAGASGGALILWFMAGAFVGFEPVVQAIRRLNGATLLAVAGLATAALVTVAGLPEVTTPTVVDPARTPASVALGIVGSVAGAAAVLAFSGLAARSDSPPTRLLAHLGRMSLQIYLAHIIFASGARVLLGGLGVDSLPIHLVVGLLAGVSGPLLLVLATRSLPWLFAPPWQGR